ncbi:MAG: signal recognition particle protein [Aquificota bacterium]|nr:MAG: signal recognition particle protein [Aquificota bacterium]
MFDSLSDRIQGILGKFKGKVRLTDKEVDATLREIRLALLEADVHIQVVRQFTESLRSKLVGREVRGGLTPTQEVIKVVSEELQELLGGSHEGLSIASRPPTGIMMVGLQGSGKTTTAAKLALMLKKQGKWPLLVAADVYRPAAVEQLITLGREVGVEVYHGDGDPVEICGRAVEKARREGMDVVIMDTAGRLHVDEPLMLELERIKELVHPQEILLVADAMTGQEAANVARTFHERLDLSGVVLTKMDGDARGGAALSIKAVTGRPIKFVGVGEKLDQLEPFHPDRMASRILGMGDVLTLIEKAEKAFSQQEAQKLQERLVKGTFTLEDFREHLRGLRKMGSMEQIIKMLPGMGGIKDALKHAKIDDREIARMEAIINSMTPQERMRPAIINSSRKRRIARGSGTSVQEVNRLLKQYAQMQKVMKGARKGGKGKLAKKMKQMPFGSDFMNMFH